MNRYEIDIIHSRFGTESETIYADNHVIKDGAIIFQIESIRFGNDIHNPLRDVSIHPVNLTRIRSITEEKNQFFIDSYIEKLKNIDS